MKKKILSLTLALMLICSMSLILIPVASAQTENGLIAWYKFDAFKDTNKVEDAVGITGDLTVYTSTAGRATITSSGKSGGALRLDNSNTSYHSYAQLPNNILNDTDDYTISTWVNVASYSNFARLFDFGATHSSRGPTAYMFLTPSNGSAGVFEITKNWEAGIETQTQNFTRQTATNTWMQLVITRNSKNTSIYKNGVLLASNDSTHSPRGMEFTRAYIGKSQFDGTGYLGYNDPYLNCTVDDFKVYNRALSAEEVAVKYIDYAATDQEAVNALVAMINVSGDLTAVMKDVSLTTSIGDVPVMWTSNNEAVVSTSGKVTRPAVSTHVNLTATITKGTASAQKTFRLYVIGAGIAPYELNVDVSKKGVDIAPDMFGLFYEDINFAADGGLYGELIRNRSFEDNTKLGYWTATGLQIASSSGNGVAEKNPNFARLSLDGAGNIVNTGFGGISIQAEKSYLFEAYVRTSDYSGNYGIALQSASGTVYGADMINAVEQNGKWTRISGVIKSNTTDTNARFALSFSGIGVVDVDMVSLFPQETFNGRQNGLRNDLALMLKDLNPGFIRFPGGCLVEGHVAGATGDACLNNAYRWKNTIGDPAERKFDYNIWNSGSLNYFQTFGLGFYEYFLLCEDVGAQPLPVLNCGMACQARNSAYPALALNSALFKEYVQDALDLIEFCNGDITTTWGAKRAAMGHPEPFNLKYLGIGNEQWGTKYYERYAAFQNEIRKYYGPDEIVLVSSSGTASSGSNYNNAWTWIRNNENGDGNFAGLVDEHYYNTPTWFLENAGRYDKFPRNTAKVFAGEYAAHGTSRANNMEAALTEAAFMTGLERNADVVRLVSYAPLFNKIGSSQWVPDMIWFNNSEAFGTPNYYVQQMYMQNQGDHTLKSYVTKNTDPEKKAAYRYYGSVGLGSWSTAVNYDDVKVVDNTSGTTLFEDDFSADTGKWNRQVAGTWTIANGMVSQTSTSATDCRYYLTDTSTREWKNYTMYVKARKTSGAEGFLIPFFVRDNNNYMHLNVGGWNNTNTAIEEAINGTKNTLIESSSLIVQNNVWYDFKIVTGEYSVDCYYKTPTDTDYKLLFSLDLTPTDYGPVYASTVKDEKSGDIIVKIINYTDNDVVTRIKMDTTGINPAADVQTLEGSLLTELNTMENKTNMSTKFNQLILNLASDGFDVNLGKYSFNVFRLHTKSNANVVESISPINVSMTTDQAPALPATVKAKMLDGSEKNLNVTWEKVNPGLYAGAGTFKVIGEVEGTYKTAEAIVTAVESSPQKPALVSYKTGIQTNDNVIVASVTNFKDTPLDAYVITATYDDDGVLLNVVFNDYYVPPHRSSDIGVAFAKPGETIKGSAKMFIWEKHSMIPLGDYATIQ